MNRARIAILALGVLLLCGAPHDFCAARESAQRVQLAATYSVEFGAFNLGDFHLTATLAGPKYELKAKGKFSFISGMIYRASGRTETTGKLSKNGAEPSQFQVTYKGAARRRSAASVSSMAAVDQNFHRAVEKAKSAQCSNNARISSRMCSILSRRRSCLCAPKDPPVHLDICKRTVPVFDGRQRFDIVLDAKAIRAYARGRSGRCFRSFGGLPREVRADRRLSA